MGKSKAKKWREKRVREGLYNPEQSRGSWNGVHPVTKKTKTKQEKWSKLENKHKKHRPHENHEDDAFSCGNTISTPCCSTKS
ncbi:hypothetical protein IMZ31_19665 (plasmid) [Pontibacillus sp. ALD_SL1]|uniref:hypothetical protein n=1 Tax=Pontibacillus sp. ALD_SL1 TaxID=2777185 RepID=UPI001A964C9A|nr:hypothetical protein [Pontibacillus sp. ALD_SL1]QST02770.1 hypothetical protein IMZ31_19665 [Pontibacillus sp. ALD_SL1]